MLRSFSQILPFKVSFKPDGDLLTIDRKVTKHHLDEK